eukprot:UN07999
MCVLNFLMFLKILDEEKKQCFNNNVCVNLSF